MGDAVSVEPLGELFPGAGKALTAEGFLHVFPQIYDSGRLFRSPVCANSTP
ncbi:Ribosomal RNA small subunit methyltransferase F [Serratia marcescens]|uniref:Ribosomal RNA small subunit methyltransferase F n=1 Tax=Serratia marcescens TaxID=615 RepID=A0A379ZVE3_SERMA|nr:Ribosomal RNA small subunit methyltransferase F [Serratia marcescens]